MFQRGIRGAITLDSNSVDEIKSNTVELLNAFVSSNHIETRDISHVIFTLTSDLTAAFPAKFARTELHWDGVPMVCFNELKVDGSIEMCMRV